VKQKKDEKVMKELRLFVSWTKSGRRKGGRVKKQESKTKEEREESDDKKRVDKKTWIRTVLKRHERIVDTYESRATDRKQRERSRRQLEVLLKRINDRKVDAEPNQFAENDSFPVYFEWFSRKE
jgi:hypothetical protein